MRKDRMAQTKKTGHRKHSAATAPTIVKRKIPVGQANSEYRNREYLSEKEVGKVAAAGAQGRPGLRDSALIHIAYRHRLRVSELVSLRWDQIDLGQGLDQLIKQEPFWAPLGGNVLISRKLVHFRGLGLQPQSTDVAPTR